MNRREHVPQPPRRTPSVGSASAIALIFLSALILPVHSADYAIINSIGQGTAIHVTCSRSNPRGVGIFGWARARADDLVEFLLFNEELRSFYVAQSSDRVYRCRFKVNKDHECEYIVFKGAIDHGRCTPQCTWEAKPDGMYFKSSNSPELGKLMNPHCSNVDIKYLKSWNHD